MPSASQVQASVCIDRTNWEFSKCRVNILMVTVGCGDFEVPLYWEMLENNGGNSSSDDRADLLGLCLEVLGKERLGYIVGDREFIGHKWLKYLKVNNIGFIMRMPKHHSIESYDGRVRRVEDLDLSRETPSTFRGCLVDGVVGDVWAKRLEGDDFLFLFGIVNVKFMAGPPGRPALPETLDDRVLLSVDEGQGIRPGEDPFEVG